MFETSLQARFVIPMAVSLGFAVMFATLLTLILVPCMYMMGRDIQQALIYLVSLLKQPFQSKMAENRHVKS